MHGTIKDVYSSSLGPGIPFLQEVLWLGGGCGSGMIQECRPCLICRGGTHCSHWMHGHNCLGDLSVGGRPLLPSHSGSRPARQKAFLCKGDPPRPSDRKGWVATSWHCRVPCLVLPVTGGGGAELGAGMGRRSRNEKLGIRGVSGREGGTCRDNRPG